MNVVNSIKRLTCIFLVLLFVSCVFPYSVFANSSSDEFLWGDYNENGIIEFADILDMNSYILGRVEFDSDDLF